MKTETFLWGKNTHGMFNLHFSNNGGTLPHSHKSATNILFQGRKRWILVDPMAYGKCEDQIDFELHKSCPYVGEYKQKYKENLPCKYNSTSWFKDVGTIEFEHYDFVQGNEF